jgi:hypothetical protein
VSAATKKGAIFAVHPKTFEPRTRQHTFRGGSLLFIRVLANQYFCIVYLRPKMKIIATNCMPEVVSDSSCDFKKVLESCPQVAS